MDNPNSNQKQSLDIQHEGYTINCYETTSEHAKEYGVISKKPLFLKNLFVSNNKRNKGNGKAILELIKEYAIKHKFDLIFGHIPQDAEFSKDERENYFSEREIIKYWLHNNGYAINEDNFDFHKVLLIEKPLRYFGGVGFSNCSEIARYEVTTEIEKKKFNKLSDAKLFYQNVKGEKAIWNLDIDELVDSWYRK
jgi:hypothetical protein